MIPPPPVEAEHLVVVRPEERPYACLVHALGWIPVWGFAFNLGAWLFYKNRSREMVFHVQQAIQYHAVVLGVVLCWSVAALVAKVVAVLSPGLGNILSILNMLLLSVAMTGLAGVAIVGGLIVLSGRAFLYPAIGERVLAGAIRKFHEE